MTSAASSEPTIMDVLAAIWAARLHVLIGAGMGLAAAFFFLLFSVPHYRVSMLVAPADQAAQADIKAFLPGNPDPVSQRRIDGEEVYGTTAFMRFEHILRGPGVAARLDARDHDRLFQGMGQICKFRLPCAPERGSPVALSEMFRKAIRIESVGNTPLRKIVFDHPSGEFGIWLLTQLYAEADRAIRADAAQGAHKRIDYLKRILEKTAHPDHRRALTSLLMEQEHRLMILAMDEPFAAVIAEPPSVSRRVWWPRRSLIFAGFAFAGALLGFTLRPSKSG